MLHELHGDSFILRVLTNICSVYMCNMGIRLLILFVVLHVCVDYGFSFFSRNLLFYYVCNISLLLLFTITFNISFFTFLR